MYKGKEKRPGAKPGLLCKVRFEVKGIEGTCFSNRVLGYVWFSWVQAFFTGKKEIVSQEALFHRKSFHRNKKRGQTLVRPLPYLLMKPTCSLPGNYRDQSHDTCCIISLNPYHCFVRYSLCYPGLVYIVRPIACQTGIDEGSFSWEIKQ